MAKKKDLMKEAAKNLVEAAKEDLVNQQEQTEEFVEVPLEEVPDNVKPLLSSFPSEDGYYGLIYKVDKLTGKWQRMDYEIEAPEKIPGGDLEGEIYRIIREKVWGDGDYRIQIKRHGINQLFLNKQIVVKGLDPKDTKESNPLHESFRVLDDAVRITERLKGPQSSPESMGNVILKAVETGQKMSEPKGGNGVDSQLLAIIEKLSPLIAPLLTRPQMNEESIVEKVVAKIQPMLQPKEDNLTSLIKLKEGLGMKFAHEVKKEDSLDSVRKVTDIVQAIKPLAGAASGEPQSILALVLDKLPVLVQPLLETVRDFAESKKMEMKLRMDQFYGGSGQMQIQNQKNLPAPRVHPFAVRLIKAVNDNDELYFDMMRQQISRLYGQHVIEGLISGEFTAELVIETIHSELGVPLSLPNLKSYIEKFIGHLQESEKPGYILAECQTCQTQYDFDDMKAWEGSDKKCEDCKGELKLVKREGEA